MKKIFAIMVCVLIGTSMVLQGAGKNTTQKKEKKSIQDSIDMKYHAKALMALADSMFVFNVNQIIFKRGMSTSVSSSTNFVSLKKKQAVIQVAFDNTPYIGPNGLGGITVEGNASGIKMETNKKGYTYFRFNVMGVGVSATVDITLYPGSNRASVIVNPNFNSRQLTLNGSIAPFNKSYIYKGSSF